MIIRIIFLALSSIMSVWLGFFAFENSQIKSIYSASIYYFISFAILLWIISIFDLYRNTSTDGSSNAAVKGFLLKHIYGIVLSVVIMLIGFWFCKPDFRILNDEALILSNSMSLASSKVSIIELSSIQNLNDTNIVLSSLVDKRPGLFQYLVSIIHTIFGYDFNNIFTANLIFSILNLFFLYYLLIELKFSRILGIIGQVILCSYPLFLIYSCSGGFENFNLLCSLIFFLLIYKLIEKPNIHTAEAILLFIPLIGQSRYESILAILVVFAVVLIVLPTNEYKKFSYKSILFPILCLPIPWLRFISDSKNNWENQKLSDLFSFSNITNNAKYAIEFFFSGNEAYYIISFISVLSLLGALMVFLDMLHKRICKKDMIFYLSIMSFYVLHAIPRLMYVFVDLRDSTAQRLAIIFLPLLVFTTIYLLQKTLNVIKLQHLDYIVLAAVFILPFIYWPDTLKKDIGCNKLIGYNVYCDARNALNKNFPQKEDFCIISQISFQYIPLGYSAITPADYHKYEFFLDKLIKENYFKYFVVIQFSVSGKLNIEIPPKLKIEKSLEIQVDKFRTIIFNKCYCG